MSRDEFMNELEYLLQDIPMEEKADAVQYYRDYFDEAGPDQEDQVAREFGSPERVAAIIRSDITGVLKDGGEFTEHGYEDERFKDPNYQMAKRYDLPEEQQQKEHADGTDDFRGEAGYTEEAYESRENGPKTNRALKVVLWIILIIVLAPAVLGIGGGAVGLIAGLAGILITVFVALGAVTLGLLIGGVGVLVAGLVTAVVQPLSGLLLLGAGGVALGLGLLCLCLSVIFYGRFLPFLIRGIVDLISGLFHRGRA